MGLLHVTWESLLLGTVLSDGLIQQLYSGAGDPGFLPSCQAMMPFLLFLRPGFEGREA